MAGTVGVLCTRQRVEEKQLMTALAEAGFVALPLSPAADPAPLGPSPSWPLADASASGVAAGIVIDRLQDRALASAVLRMTSPDQLAIIDAGIASVEDRVSVAATLARAGLPRPLAFVVHNESSALKAAEATGYPATFLPLEPKLAGLMLYDRDTAEAVMEHREMLGARGDTLGIVQSGWDRDAITVIVADGRAVGFEGNASLATVAAFELAVRAASVLLATLVGIVIVGSAQGPVVWDVDPAPDFRSATPVEEESVAVAIARFAGAKLTGGVSSPLDNSREARHDIVAYG